MSSPGAVGGTRAAAKEQSGQDEKGGPALPSTSGPGLNAPFQNFRLTQGSLVS